MYQRTHTLGRAVFHLALLDLQRLHGLVELLNFLRRFGQFSLPELLNSQVLRFSFLLFLVLLLLVPFPVRQVFGLFTGRLISRLLLLRLLPNLLLPQGPLHRLLVELPVPTHVVDNC